MATKKVSVTIPEHLVDHTQAEAARQGISLSAYAAKAIREQLIRDAMRQLAEDGYTGLSADEIAEAEEVVEQVLEEERRLVLENSDNDS
jgi:hypothetical protein